MDNDDQVKQRILEASKELFFQYGFSRVTVDEIAAKIGISKKTIYKYFSSKEEIVDSVAKVIMNEMDRSCDLIMNEDGGDFVFKMKKMMTNVAVQYARVGTALLEDLQKYAPNVWKEIADFRTERINKRFGTLLEEGIEQGYLRKDIDRRLVLMIYGNAIQTIIQPEMLLQLPFSAVEIYETIVKVIFEGILTDEAKPKYLSHSPILSLAHQRI